jgi:hypothetical protein
MEKQSMQVNRTYILNPKLTPVQLADAIMERCNKLYALSNLCQSADFLDYKEELIQNYFWLQSSMILELTELFETFKEEFNS